MPEFSYLASTTCYHVFSYLPNQTLEVQPLFWLRERRQVSSWREVRASRIWMPGSRDYPVGRVLSISEAKGKRGAQAELESSRAQVLWEDRDWETQLPRGVAAKFSWGWFLLRDSRHFRVEPCETLAASPIVQALNSSCSSASVASYSWSIPPESQVNRSQSGWLWAGQTCRRS